MKTVHDVSKLAGISVHTLHYYDSIELLSPTETTEAGYRPYDEEALGRLQCILLFRELKFPLKDIKEIDEYARQAKDSYGNTPAYKEFEEKSKKTAPKSRNKGSAAT